VDRKFHDEDLLVRPEDICRDFPEWPDRWKGDQKDKVYGEGILEEMRPFVEHLIAKGLAKKTIRSYMDNLWLLGGEIIRKVSLYDSYNVPPRQVIEESVGPDGGLSCRHLHGAAEQRSYNATCMRLWKFLCGRQ
jgi:hypothetical protein